MQAALLGFALQIGFAALPPRPPQARDAGTAVDSIRDLKRAHAAQARFEFVRRNNLPERSGSDGRCDVHLGRFCWWYDEIPPTLPAESKSVARRRDELLATLDSLGDLHPGDHWIVGMRVHYRIDGGNAAAADTVARDCRAASWWCSALTGYADHVLGQAVAAETAFVDAFGAMPESERCAWRDISTLLPSKARDRYEKLSCTARAPIEARYWLLSRPQLGTPANEWRTEFYVRRVQARLAERATNPQPGGWGNDAAELLLRYGWPMGWSRVASSPYAASPPSVIGHDPVPSFAFAPTIDLLDSLASATDAAWKLQEHLAESRFAPRLVHRVAPVAAQFARFRRGDSTLLVAAYAVRDDSLGHSAAAAVGATVGDGRTFIAPTADSAGHAKLSLPESPLLAGVEVADTLTRTLGRARVLYALGASSPGLALSDLLLYRSGESPPASLDSALAAAIPGDTISRARPVGIYWETYGAADSSQSLDISVTVERIDRSWLRSARQRVHLAAPDSPLRLLWSDSRPPEPGGAAVRAVSLDLANLEPGRYRLTVALSRAGGTPVSSARELQLGER
ncbi:MAG: hypothetical protein JWL95_2086 [Gemmatimonadetes bacterium]|nr:hypothetical protein [Gemmatimonadota bacterium]